MPNKVNDQPSSNQIELLRAIRKLEKQLRRPPTAREIGIDFYQTVVRLREHGLLGGPGVGTKHVGKGNHVTKKGLKYL